MIADKEEAMTFAKNVIDLNSNNLDDPKDLIENHLPFTYDIALELSSNILEKYPFLGQQGFIPAKIALAGGLHDIGRVLDPNQTFHELRSYFFVKKEGFSAGLADRQREVDEIAATLLPHGSLYETWEDPVNQELKRQFEEEYGPINPGNLLPRTLGETIVDLAELSNFKGKRMDFSERLEDAVKRYEAKGDPRARSIIKGSKRRKALCSKVISLVNGQVSEEKVQYMVHNMWIDFD